MDMHGEPKVPASVCECDQELVDVSEVRPRGGGLQTTSLIFMYFQYISMAGKPANRPQQVASTTKRLAATHA